MQTGMIKKAILLILIFGMFGCQQSTPELREVSVMLKWKAQAQFAGFFVAKELGYYEDAGLDVNIKDFDFVTFPADAVDSREFEFASIGGDEAILARSRGNNIKAIAAIFQKNPLGFVTTKGIIRPSDLKGKKLGLQKGVQSDYLLRILLRKGKVDESEVEFVKIQFDDTLFSDGEIDLFPLYITQEPFTLEKEGMEFDMLMPYDYGINFYGDVLITHEALIRDNPGLVNDFLNATLKGYRYSLENFEETVEIMKKYEDAEYSSPGHEEYILTKQHPLIYDGTHQIGWMERDVWNYMYEIMLEHNAVQDAIDINDVYTTEFIEKIYE